MKKNKLKILAIIAVAILPLLICATFFIHKNMSGCNVTNNIEFRREEDAQIISKLTNEKLSLEKLLEDQGDLSDDEVKIAMEQTLTNYYDSEISLAEKFNRIKSMLSDNAIEILFPMTDPNADIQTFTTPGEGNSSIQNIKVFVDMENVQSASAVALFELKTSSGGKYIKSNGLFSCKLKLNEKTQWAISEIEQICFYKE